jgi:hypothetical protein
MRSVKKEMLRDLDAAYRSIVVRNAKEGCYLSRMDVCKILAKSPAPRLYITPEYAMRVIKGHPRCQSSTYSTSRMHQELLARYNSLPEGSRTLVNVEMIINQPAPSFYLSPIRISDLLYKVYDRRE